MIGDGNRFSDKIMRILMFSREHTAGPRCSSEKGAAHYPLMVALHALWLLGLGVLAWRIHVENRALAWAAQAEHRTDTLMSATLANWSLRR